MVTAVDKLCNWAEEQGLSDAAVARRVDVNKGHICDIKNGRLRPKLGLMLRFEIATFGAVRVLDWLTETERAQLISFASEIATDETVDVTPGLRRRLDAVLRRNQLEAA